ncbi:unnamed protein product [Diabrotica balteata]|uniref:Poly [ADP-ribose] polymerase n=1 Tax=Diabrotica balteata TaxID=107213 RepID=A0A9N9TD98_DIABA|nr:unnamed protein product [Diabrotica balteata]
MILTSKIDDTVPPLWMTFFTRIQSAKKIKRNLCGCFSKTLFEKLFPETVNLPCDICNRHDFIHFEDVGNSKNNFTFIVKRELNINLTNELNTTKNDNITTYVPTVKVGSNIKNAFFKEFDYKNVYKLETVNEHSNEININLANQLNTIKNDNIAAYVPTVKVGSNIQNAFFKEFKDYQNVYKLETGNARSNEFNRIKQVSFSNNINNIVLSIERKYNPYDQLQYDKNFDDENVYKLETVNEHSNEFNRIKEEFVGNNINRIHSIQKVHNPYLLLQYDLRKLEYEKRGRRYKEKRLFHGTKKSNISGICERNFNWRLTGSSTGHLFGQGVNFSPCANYCTHYGDPTYNKWMILALVIVSKCCLGTSEMKIPLDGCDTSIKENGLVYVKYDDNSYYPQYLIHYESNLCK